MGLSLSGRVALVIGGTNGARYRVALAFVTECAALDYRPSEPREFAFERRQARQRVGSVKTIDVVEGDGHGARRRREETASTPSSRECRTHRSTRTRACQHEGERSALGGFRSFVGGRANGQQGAASGRSRDRDVTARNQDFCVVRVSMFFLI